MNIIEIVDFSLKIKDKVLFDNVNLNIKEHSWLVLTGNIGSGKSTLLRTICKLNKEKYDGLITYKEKNIVDIPMQEHVRNIGYVMQHAINQFVMPTLEEEIIFALENLCLEAQVINEKLEYALSITKTKELANKHIHTLSGGERQRAAFAVALAMGSEILILDEPFANVDKKTRSSLLTLLKDLNNQGVTIIVCDHEYQLYLNYADTFYYLSNGSLELIENPSIKNTTINLAKNIQTEELLKLEDVIITQGNKKLLNTTNFKIHKGITTLTGDNGTGKTTLLHAISQLKKYKGNIYFKDSKVKKSRKLYRKISTCLQDAFQQFISLMPREEISMQKDIWNHANMWQERLLKEFDLEKELDKSLYYYSGGQRKLIQLMCLLSQKTDLLLLDEPFTHLDERACSFIMDWIEENKKLVGQSFIIVSHRLEPLNNRSDYHIEISNNTLHCITEDNYGKENN
ncbi:ABC transporter ATP-binding protein [Gemella haemolysans]|uniref:ABC transporter ATP-binding protein n=1 Tax=Gemella haemolysans TaxID=1379 RepID=A0AAW6B6W1_9BACL|nr:ABC transporter ATP-binding protein [Gemella haemolysans]MDB6186207.1 ABC transporter ATP-binding protein [Gemella haemolysans]MDU4713545.1 ABC transporter ATP-binding protein [Gemella haemolysans]